MMYGDLSRLRLLIYRSAWYIVLLGFLYMAMPGYFLNELEYFLYDDFE